AGSWSSAASWAPTRGKRRGSGRGCSRRASTACSAAPRRSQDSWTCCAATQRPPTSTRRPGVSNRKSHPFSIGRNETVQTHPAESFLAHIDNPHLAAIQRIQTVVLEEMQRFAVENGFIQLMPILISPFTDPLSHDVYSAQIAYEEMPLKLTASMIFHKQLALAGNIDRIFIVSPNVRLEKAAIKSSENHLLEFSQFDIEMKNASMDEVMHFHETLLLRVGSRVRADSAGDLAILGRTLPGFSSPFPRFSSDELRERLGDDFYRTLSEQTRTPCFVTNFKREFYDREDPARPGTYRNFDLVYPDGYGEALSGAEREYRYEDILRRMQELGMDLSGYENYLEVARQGRLLRTAGAGIGIQRLVKFLCGKRRIAEVCVFDRSVASAFVF